MIRNKIFSSAASIIKLFIILFLIISKNKSYTNDYVNSRENFDKLVILLFDFLKKSNIKIQDINNVFVNQGPGKFSGIRASIAAAKGICIGNNLDIYGFNTNQVEGNDYSSIMRLFERGILIKNLIKPHYLS